MIKVGVLFGGESVEHEVSIISAIQAINKLDNEKYEVIPIYITKDGEWYTGGALKEIETYNDMDLLKRYTTNVVLFKKNNLFVLQKKSGLFKGIVDNIDIILPVVHGTNVEDGVLQGYLKTIGVPFVGSGVLASAIAQDKVIQKQLFEGNKLPTTKFYYFYDSDFEYNKDEVIKNTEKLLKYPLIVKPASLGSSVGVSSVENKKELIKALEEAFQYDCKVIVEEKVSNLKDVNISVLGNYENQELSEIEEVITLNSFLTYKDKYMGNKKSGSTKGMASASRKIPADIPKEVKEDIKRIATEAFKVIGLSGNVRIDFLVDSKAKKAYINEINACPGSLAFYLWQAAGKEFTTLLDDMINIAIKDYKNLSSKTHSFDTNILAGYDSLKGSKGKLK